MSRSLGNKVLLACPGNGRGRPSLTLAAALLALTGASKLQAQTPPAPAAPAVASPTNSVGVNLNITPKRLTFDRNGRSATVYIFNQGTAPAIFDIAVTDRVMLPTGEIKGVTEAESTPEGKALVAKLNSAKPLVIATPRRATLEPGKGQTIRIRVSPPPAGATAAEYRSHLTVTTIPPRDTGLTAEQVANQRPGELSFRIQTVFGISIPLIVRPTAVDVEAEIENVQLNYVDISADGVAPPKRTPVLAFDLMRSGANSLFGNLEVKSATDADKTPLGTARGVGVYPEIDRRTVRIPLQRAPKAGEQLVITFTDDDSKAGSVAARSTFTVR